MSAQNLWKLQMEELLSEITEQTTFERGELFVIGCSTSEVAGERIGTAGAFEIGEALYEPLKTFADQHGLYLAFQGCEHINRALTIERLAAKHHQLAPVSVIPTVQAGGSMSAFAYSKMEDPIVVEEIEAQAGIDIGQTLIGMHLKKVAVPLRTSVDKIGEAVATIATTRPKLIGGARAVYEIKEQD